MLDGPLDLPTRSAEPLGEPIERARLHRESKMDMGTAFVPVLLLARTPETESSRRTDREPDAILVARQLLESEALDIEPGKALRIV